MRKNLLFLSLLLTTSLVAFSADPTGSGKKSKVNKRQQLIEVVQQGTGKSFLIQPLTEYSKPISFMITDKKGVVVMFGDNYRSGSNVDLSHFQTGEYTFYFDKDTNSAEARIFIPD